ncbi:MAG: hypothetical protein ABR976_10025 [Terracidiphilus sp.]|jgi:hypothetical protein
MTNELPLLIVPINVEAFCVNQKVQAAQFLPGMTQFQSLPFNDESPVHKPFLSERVMAHPFSTGSINAGVHLHWAMPDALMHGEQAKENEAGRKPGDPPAGAFRFPRLPDRWLVTRTSLTAQESEANDTQSWVVDSRFVAEELRPGNEGSSAIPWENPDDPEFLRPPYRYLGRTLPLDQWSAPHQESLLSELTVASLGLLQAPSYYPSSRNVFGMHHAAPRKATEYCYTVCGWHTEKADDPLSGKNAEQTAKALAKLEWKSPHGETVERVLYVGVVHSVRWDPDLEPGSPASITAVFGNTTAEATSVFLKESATDPSPAFCNQLQALISGQLDRLSEPGGDLRVNRQFHQQRFSPVAFTNFWYAAKETDGTDAFSSLDAEHKKLLHELNEAEQVNVTRREEASARQWQLFADWYKYLKCKYPEGEDLPHPDDVRAFIEEQSLPRATLAIKAARSAAEAAATALKRLKDVLPPAFVLTARPQASCWRPVDPVLLLQGKDVKPAVRFNGDGVLPCQVSGASQDHAMLWALDLRDGDVPGVGPARLDYISDMPDLGPDIDKLGPPRLALQTAVLEGRLLWPSWAGSRLAVRAGKPESAPDVSLWLAAKDPQKAGSPWTGKPPAPKSVTNWSGNPWLPMMMHWDISYQPLAIIQESEPAHQFPPEMLMKRLSDSLDADEVDLVLKHPSRAKLGDNLPRHYQGITFITPQAGKRVKEQLRAHAQSHPVSMLAAIEPIIEDLPLLSQSLSGFHDRLLLRRQTLQVDVRDPFARGPFEQDFARDVEEAVMALGTRVNTLAPVVHDAFSPVRGGDFTLERLWLGDVFGQCREYSFRRRHRRAKLTENKVLVAPSLGRKEGKGMQPTFPPRMSQPVRLDFNWVLADGNADLSGQDPSTSPVFGWIVPNYLDQSLAIYEGSGDPLGSIMALRGVLAWQGSPARPETFGLKPEDLFKGRNPHLRDFTLAFLHQKEGVKYLKAYMETLNRGMTMIQPLQAPQHATLPMLAGHPLALVRASLKLNLVGPPAVNQTWAAFEQDFRVAQFAANEGNPLIERTTNHHEDVKYPVVLGVVTDPDDGLVGFYQGRDEGEERFAEFRAIAEPRDTVPGIDLSKVHTIQIAAAESRHVLTMLVDPRTEVVVTAGYAPSQSQLLPPEATKNAIARIAVTFLAAPVLTREKPPADENGKVSLPLPLPGQQKGVWNWVRVVNDAKGDRRAIVAGTDLVSASTSISADPVYLQEGWLSLGEPAKRE